MINDKSVSQIISDYILAKLCVYTYRYIYTWSGTSYNSFMFDIAYCRFTWRDCSTMLKLILCLPTGSVLCWVRYCWRPRSGMTRPCGMWTTVRSWRTLQWRTCKSGSIEHPYCQGVKMNIFLGSGGGGGLNSFAFCMSAFGSWYRCCLYQNYF